MAAEGCSHLGSHGKHGTTGWKPNLFLPGAISNPPFVMQQGSRVYHSRTSLFPDQLRISDANSHHNP